MSVRLAYQRGHQAGLVEGYKRAADDEPLIAEALAATRQVDEIAQRDGRQQEIESALEIRVSQEIQTPNLDRIRGYCRPPADPVERELAELIAEPDDIGVIREAEISDHQPHCLGRSEVLRDLLAMSLAQAEGNDAGWRAVMTAIVDRPDRQQYLAAMVSSASVVISAVIQSEAEDGGICLSCAASAVARLAESG